MCPLPKKTISSRKRTRLLEGKSAQLQEVSSLKENPERFSHHHHLVTLAAFRYALRRRSYIVGEIVDWLIEYWGEIPQETLNIILTETEEAVMISSCGDQCDQAEWERFLDFAHKKSRFI